VIVPIHDLFFEGEDPWIVMEFIDAQSLESLIFQQPLPDLKVARMGLQVARGLSAAHRAQVVHRDVKPENILATEDDVIFLVDFGIARIAGTRGVTQVNRVVGTSGYLSPERITGEQPDNPAGDLWSLGVTFYYAITGRHPFRENGELNDVKTADAIRHQPPRPLGTESRLESLILSLLDKDPGRRPDADKVIEALTTILRGTRRSASAYPAASAPRDTAPADNSRRPPEGSRVPRPDSPGDRHGERRSRAPGGPVAASRATPTPARGIEECAASSLASGSTPPSTCSFQCTKTMRRACLADCRSTTARP